MDCKRIGGITIPVLGVGTWGIGGRLEADESRREEETAAIREALRLGYTHIDTAEVYGNGLTEKIVGEAINGAERKKLFITSKVWHTNLTRKGILDAIQGSLQRLGTDYLDLYLVHWPNRNMDMQEVMEAMKETQEKGCVKAIGVSNFSLAQIKEARQHATIAAVQNEYHVLLQNKELLEFCSTEDIALIAYRPLARGHLAKPGIALLDTLAEKYGRTQAQIALNWLLAKKNVVTIPKATSKEHLKDNLGALGWAMDAEDARALDDYQ